MLEKEKPFPQNTDRPLFSSGGPIPWPVIYGVCFVKSLWTIRMIISSVPVQILLQCNEFPVILSECWIEDIKMNKWNPFKYNIDSNIVSYLI